MRILICLVLLAISLVAGATPIEFVVKSAAGGPDDVITRKMVEHIEKDTNLKFVVINKPGAAHIIGYNYFESKTTPALIVADSNMINHSVINSSDRIFTVGDFTNILFVKNGSSIKSLDDLVALSKEREILFGHGGVSALLAANTLCEKLLRCLLVPYKSGAPGMLDVLTGTIDAYALVSYGASRFVTNDLYRPILMYSTSKHPTFDIPLLPRKHRELEMRNWIAIYGRNISLEDRETIRRSLSKINSTFFIENGLYR